MDTKSWRVEVCMYVAGTGDNRKITVTVAATLSGNFVAVSNPL